MNGEQRRVLPHDKSGFLVGERLVSGMDAVKSDTDEILSLLRTGLKRGEQADVKSQRALDGIQRNTRVTREIGGRGSSANGSGTSGRGVITRQAREAADAGARRSGGGMQPSQSQQRDERGRFMQASRDEPAKAEKAESKRTGILASLVHAVRGRFGVGGSPDTENLDPTLTAIHEARQLAEPFSRVGGMMFKAGGWLMGRGKKGEELPKEQRRHNRLIEKLLKRIAGEGGAHGGGGSLFGGLFSSLAGLLRPFKFLMRGGMAGLGIAGAWLGGQAIGKWIYDKFEPQISAVADAIGASVKTAIEAYDKAIATVSSGIEWIANKLGWLKDKGGAVIDRVKQDFGMSPGNPGRSPAKAFTNDKASAVQAVAQRLGIDPNDLATVISFETGGTFDPAKRNPTSNATGLIQFMPETAKGLGTTTDALAKMSFSDQMQFVEKYLRQAGVGQNGKTGLGAIYDAITGVPKSGYKAYSSDARNRAAYYANTVWDTNGDLSIDPGEAVQSPRFQAHRAAYFPAGKTVAMQVPSSASTPGIGVLKIPPAPKVDIPISSNRQQPVFVSGGIADISQNVADRAIAHALTGGLGMDNFRGP